MTKTKNRSASYHAARHARDASYVLSSASGAQRTDAILRIAEHLRANVPAILEANAQDLSAGRTKGLAPSFLDRLELNEDRIEAMARAVTEIAGQDDPIGAVEHSIIRPNGLRVARERIPLGVVAVIYEARPNVTSDAAALALRSGNAIILKGGSDAKHSNRAIGDIVIEAVRAARLHEESVQVLTSVSRDDIAELVQYDDLIDVVIPRGGENLIRFVAEHSSVPVLKHYKGVCHLYIDAAANLEMALEMASNGKASRPSACNSVETILVHEDVAAAYLPALKERLDLDEVTIHGCAASAALLGGDVVAATEADWEAEYLSLDVALRVVPSLDGAIEHIRRYTSDHTEAIISDSLVAAQRFRSRIQSGCVMINASTRFADGGELGLGAEIGISTSRLHAYGPMGVEGLTTTRFVVTGDGQVRT